MKEIKFALSLMTPAAWLVLLVAALACIGGGVYVGFRVASGIAEIDALKIDRERSTERFQHATALAQETKKVTDLEKARIKDVSDIGVRHQQEIEDAKTHIDALRADVRSGAVRLSIAVKARPAGSCAASGDPAAAASAGDEARAELMPEAAETLIGIAADGDDAVRSFNACHDAYEAIRLRELK